MAISKKDIELMKEVFVTKADAEQAEQRANNRHNEVMTMLDSLIKVRLRLK